MNSPTISSVGDLTDFHLIKNYFATTVREVAIAVNRSAHSPMLADASSQYGHGDTDNAILTANGELIATNERTITHMASLPTALRAILRGRPTVAEGDVWITNDPYQGAVHPNDVCVLRPVFWRGELEYWVGVLSHLTDIGGASPGGIAVGATSLFAEGLIIPPLRLFDAGELNTTVLAFIEANCRTPSETIGDVYALVSGAHVGARRIAGLLEEKGAERVRQAIADLFDYTQRQTRAGIAKLADGTFTAESWCDDDGIDVNSAYAVRATVTIDGDRLKVDLTGTDRQVRGSTNASYSQTVNAITYAAKVYTARTVPLNEGFWRCVDIVLPPGTVVNPTKPAPCNNRMANTVPATVEAVMWAIAQAAAPELGRVAGCGVPEVHVTNPVDGGYWLHLDCLWGGYGARNTKDGIDAGGNAFVGGGTGIMPIEPAELAYDIRCISFALRTDTGGPGRFRGGLGIDERWEFLRDCVVSCRTDRWKLPPAGVEGGLPGRPGAYILNPDTPDETLLASKFSEQIFPKGSTISYQTCGGGGYGSPLEREPSHVLSDVEADIVSVGAALDDYGVVLCTDGVGGLCVDLAATQAARKERAS